MLLIFFLFSIIFAFKNDLSIKKNHLFIFISPFIFLTYLLITGVINNIPLIITAVSFRDYFQYILFFFFLIVFFSEYMFEIIHKFILFFGVVFLISSVYQIVMDLFNSKYRRQISCQQKLSCAQAKRAKFSGVFLTLMG